MTQRIWPIFTIFSVIPAGSGEEQRASKSRLRVLRGGGGLAQTAVGEGARAQGEGRVAQEVKANNHSLSLNLLEVPRIHFCWNQNQSWNCQKDVRLYRLYGQICGP